MAYYFYFYIFGLHIVSIVNWMTVLCLVISRFLQGVIYKGLFSLKKFCPFLCYLIVSLPWLDLFSEQEKSELDVEGGQIQGQKMAVEISNSGHL